jgi:D-alanine-D-alanine ligase
MRIGITYDLKSTEPLSPDLPDDFEEEFDSPATVEAISGVLRKLGHEVLLLGDGRELLQRLLNDPPDLVFNIAEGRGIARSREARVPAVLEMLQVPHTGSDPLTCAVTLDKDCAKRLAISAGVTCPGGVVLRPGEDVASVVENDPAFPGFPALVKPAWEGSSKGIRSKSIVEGPDELNAVVESLWRDHRQPLLVEEFIAGDELTVGVIGNDNPQVLGVMRVLPLRDEKRFIYSLEVKRDWEQRVRYECPARISPKEMEAVREAALRAYRVLGCRDVARIDFRLRRGVPYFLEVNPLPGLNPETGDLIILARHSGWSYERLIEGILSAALDRLSVTSLATGAR